MIFEREFFVFVKSMEGANVVYSVPEPCLFRLATSPLQHVFRDSAGKVTTAMHHSLPPSVVIIRSWRSDRVVRASLPAACRALVDSRMRFLLSAFPAMQESRPNFVGSVYGGMHCGATVLTTVVYIEKFMLFHSIALPIAETLNYNGIPALFRFIDGDRKYAWSRWHAVIPRHLPRSHMYTHRQTCSMLSPCHPAVLQSCHPADRQCDTLVSTGPP